MSQSSSDAEELQQIAESIITKEKMSTFTERQ
jgi:hypothetical protein